MKVAALAGDRPPRGQPPVRRPRNAAGLLLATLAAALLWAWSLGTLASIVTGNLYTPNQWMGRGIANLVVGAVLVAFALTLWVGSTVRQLVRQRPAAAPSTRGPQP